MLTIVHGSAVIKWTVGDVLPYGMSFESVTHVIADGDELEYIEQAFINIPQRSPVGRMAVSTLPSVRGNNTKFANVLKRCTSVPTTVHWFGDHARFIVANLIGNSRGDYQR